ncbi:MAG TPA: hypothetical protein VH701_19630, partial [Vicinamibacterales bacterium]
MTQELDIPSAERIDRAALAALQGQRLGRLLAGIYGPNRFYTAKLDRAGIRLDDLQLPRDLRRLPLTTKTELVADQIAHPPWGTAYCEPMDRYTRYCQTSS